MGKPAYALPDRFASGRSIFVPYIFTDHELFSLFREIDAYQYPIEPLRPVLLSTYFRLTYTCGLRPNEGRLLKKQDVDLHTGEVRILNIKMQKSRTVVISDDMLSMAKAYTALRDAACSDSEYFFPSPDGTPYTSRWMQGKFKRFFAHANPGIPKEFLPLQLGYREGLFFRHIEQPAGGIESFHLLCLCLLPGVYCLIC